jgi:hypothetical protein
MCAPNPLHAEAGGPVNYRRGEAQHFQAAVSLCISAVFWQLSDYGRMPVREPTGAWIITDARCRLHANFRGPFHGAVAPQQKGFLLLSTVTYVVIRLCRFRLPCSGLTSKRSCTRYGSPLTTEFSPPDPARHGILRLLQGHLLGDRIALAGFCFNRTFI